jgi:hypothetical protein
MMQNMMMQMHEKSHNHLPNVTWHNYLDIDIWSNVDEATHVIWIAFHNMSMNEITPCEQVMLNRSWSIDTINSCTINSCTRYKFTWIFFIEASWSAFKCFELDNFTKMVKILLLSKGNDPSLQYVGVLGKGGVGNTRLAQKSIIAYMCNNTFKKCFDSLWAKIHNIMFPYCNLNNKLCFTFELLSCSSWMITWIVHMIFRERVIFFLI